MANDAFSNTTPISKIMLTHDQLAAIGAVAVESAYLESLVQWIIVDLTGVKEQYVDLFLNRSMLGSKLDDLKKIGKLKLKSESKKEKFCKIIADLKHHNNNRTIAIHGVWMSYRTLSSLAFPETPPPREPTATSKNKTITASAMQKLAEQIHKSAAELASFHSKTWMRRKVIRRITRVLSKLPQQPPAR